MSASPILSLWRGEVSLARVFWEYVIGWGTLINLLCTGAALIAFLKGAPAWLGLLLHFATLPFNAFLLVSVWRSAVSEQGSVLARVAPATTTAWFILMLVI